MGAAKCRAVEINELKVKNPKMTNFEDPNKRRQFLVDQWNLLYLLSPNHKHWTPIPLAEEIVEKTSKRTDWSGDICVLYCVSIFWCVFKRVANKYGLEHAIEHVTFIASDMNKIEFCQGMIGGKLKHKFIAWSELKTRFKEFDMKFDIVIGNPPYNNDNSSGFWTEFLRFDLLYDNGLLVLITPTNWVYSYHKSHDVIFSHEVIHACVDCREHFPLVGESTGWFIAKNSPSLTDEITLTDSTGIEYKHQRSNFMVPFGLTPLIFSILNKVIHKSEKMKFIKGSNCGGILEDEESDNCKYKAINHIWGFKYTTNLPPKFGEPRVFISRTLVRKKRQRVITTYADIAGECHHVDGFFSCVDNPNRHAWFIGESKIMRFIVGFTDKSHYLSPEVRNNIPMTNNTVVDDESAYSFFNLTQTEIDLIESYF